MHRAFVPTVHLSDLGSKASRAKYKVGQKVRGRVLERDAASKRIVMTLKKALVGSKLPAIVHLEVCWPLHCTYCTPLPSNDDRSETVCKSAQQLSSSHGGLLT